MSTRYIRQNRNSFSLTKGSRNYGKFESMDDAVFVRDLLIENDWDLDSIGDVYQNGGQYWALGVIDEKVYLLGKFTRKPSRDVVKKLYKKRMRNPNNSKCGLNITRVFDTFIIKKRIAGDDYVFGYYDNLDDAQFARNHLLDNDWNVESFSQIQYDEDSDTYRVVEVIDDKAYVLTTSKSDDIDIGMVRSEFLNRITKHKLGLASHDYLGELTDRISELEERFATTAKDDVWSFDSEQPLDIVFRLTPFQKSVYDAVDNSTVADIEKSLIRFKSGNFTRKIQKNLDELEKSGLICRNENHYIKKSQ